MVLVVEGGALRRGWRIASGFSDRDDGLISACGLAFSVELFQKRAVELTSETQRLFRVRKSQEKRASPMSRAFGPGQKKLEISVLRALGLVLDLSDFEVHSVWLMAHCRSWPRQINVVPTQGLSGPS